MLLRSKCRRLHRRPCGEVRTHTSAQASLGACCNLAINQWWVRRRGSVMGLAGLANSLLGAGLMPLVLARANASLGWRSTYMLCGALLLALLLPLWWGVVRDSPEAEGPVT